MLNDNNIISQNQYLKEKQITAQNQKIKIIQSDMQEGEKGEDQKSEHDLDKNSEGKIEAESKNDISIPQFQSKFSQQLTGKLKSQKIGLISNINNNDNIKQFNHQMLPNNEEIEFKKQENLSQIAHQQSLSFQNQSYSAQIPNLMRFDSYLKSPQYQSQDSKEKIFQNTSPTFQQNQMKQKLILKNKVSQNQKQILNTQASNQQVNESLKILNEKQFSQKLEDKLFSTKLFKRRDQLEYQDLNKQILKKIEQKIDDSLDFLKFFKEVLFLKKAALILLSKDQLAAIQLIGIDIQDIEPSNHVVQQKQEGEDYAMNYMKEQFEILQSTELQSQYIKIFLQKCQNKQSVDPIDKRILSSLIINQKN
ncbi:hypothetical protein ABPG74_021967 [Tetrahymena malaccensis]